MGEREREREQTNHKMKLNLSLGHSPLSLSVSGNVKEIYDFQYKKTRIGWRWYSCKPNFGKLGLQLKIRFRAEYQSVVTLVESNLESNNYSPKFITNTDPKRHQTQAKNVDDKYKCYNLWCPLWKITLMLQLPKLLKNFKQDFCFVEFIQLLPSFIENYKLDSNFKGS